MPHISNLGFHLNIVRLLNREVANDFALLVGNSDFCQDTITDGTEYPDFVAPLDEIIVAFTNQVPLSSSHFSGHLVSFRRSRDEAGSVRPTISCQPSTVYALSVVQMA